MNEFESQSIRIKDILKDMKNENKYYNSILSKKQKIQHIMVENLNKKKKEIECLLQKNNELERMISELKISENFAEDYAECAEESKVIQNKIKELQTNETIMIQKLNEIITKRENLKKIEVNEIAEKNKKLNLLKNIIYLYINFTRIRWKIQDDKPLSGFHSLANNQAISIEVNKDANTYDAVNDTWNQLQAIYKL